MSGLLGHLATRLARHPENVATEALAYLLGVPAVAEAFEAFLRPAAALPAGLRYETQVSGADGARPDLAGTDTVGATTLLVEVKFWAGLTRNQPGTYLLRLPGDRPAMLLFVVPAVRVERLWTEVCRSATQHDGGLRHAPADGQRVLAMTSWRTLLDHLSEAADAAGARDARADLDQLRGLCDLMDDERHMPLTAGDLDPLAGPPTGKFDRLIKDAADRAAGEELIAHPERDTALPRKTAGSTWHGRSLRLAGVRCWLRLSTTRWTAEGRTPIWLQVGEQGSARVGEHLEALAGLRAQRRSAGFVDVPIHLQPDIALDEVVTSMAAQIRAVADRLAPGAGA